MKIHLSLSRERMWMTIEEGPQIPMIRNPTCTKDGSKFTLPKYIHKDREDYTREDIELSNLRSIVLNEIMNIGETKTFLR